MPTVTIEIDGVEYATLPQDSLTIEGVNGSTIDTVKFKLYDPDVALEIPVGKDIIITRDDTGERIFGGIVAYADDWPDGIVRWYELGCQDWTVLLDTTFVLANYASDFGSDAAIIVDLVNNKVLKYDGTIGTPPSPLAAALDTSGGYVSKSVDSMPNMNFVYVSLREAIQQIANISAFNYDVDYEGNLHYYLKQNVPAPYELSDAPDGVLSVGYSNVKRRRDATHLGNSLFLFGNQILSNPFTFFLTGDGSSKILTLNYADFVQGVYDGLDGQATNFALVPPPGELQIAVYKNTGSEGVPVWTAQDVGNNSVDTIPPVDVLFDSLGKTLEFATAPANLAHAVKITASYLIGAAQPLYDPDSIALLGRQYSRRIVAGDVASAVALTQKGFTLLQQFSTPLHKITLSIDDGAFPAGNTARFKVGQFVTFTNAILGILQQQYQIYSMKTTILGADKLFYSLELRNWFVNSLL